MSLNLNEARAKETLEILRKTQAILENDHFVYVSGDHGSGWVDKDRIYPNTQYIFRLSQLLAETVASVDADMICGPAIGGLIIGQWTAHHLGLLSVFSEHDPTYKPPAKNITGVGLKRPFILRRGYDSLVAGKKVLVVDDIVNTGFSLKQTAEAVTKAGGIVVAAAALVTRGNVDAAQLGVEKFLYLLEYKIPAWPAASCKLCQEGVPINTHYAHGQEFVSHHE